MPANELEEHFRDFTPAEREALLLLADGAHDQEIADELVVSVHAVRARLRRAAIKLGRSGRPEVAWASRHKHCCLESSA